jgi:hypothetical protein
MARRDSVAWRWLRLRAASKILLGLTCGACEDEDAIAVARDALDAAIGALDDVVAAPGCDCCGGPHPDEDCPGRQALSVTPRDASRDVTGGER